ncbi:MAG: dihydrofolate reductase family protein [Actinomyces sp.]|uniref:dihydrofolate reductase family protein n=1 Tax=Actinomyces sp. TaxID=29317 RepID=UPI0026DCEF2F|nr:dihydrofolate reductase family protein [Actinomyces sp.]MDO4244304.1 dihydrofolate reductase family protein [Actinomyces sp.]
MTNRRAWRGRVFIGVSLDGYIARLDGDINWLTDPPLGRDHARIDSSRHALNWESFFPGIDHVVMGRNTYDTVIGFDEWPDMWSGKSVVVLSTSLPRDTEHITVARTLNEAVAFLNESQAREVYVDGGKAIQSFLRAGLIDEITISWAPVLIGGGRRLFDVLDDDVLLTLRGSHTTENGMVGTTYHVTPA